MISGIYKIRNLINDKIYIGSSVDVNRRLTSHRNLLNKQKHHSYKLQRAWNKYGESNFELILIEEVYFNSSMGILYKLEILESLEQFYLDKYLAYSKNNYNVSPNAGIPRGDNPSNNTKKSWIKRRINGQDKFSDEHKKNISRSLQNSELLKRKLRENAIKKRKKVYQYNMEGEFVKEWNSIQDLIASDSIKFKYSGIIKCMRKKIQNYKGFVFSRIKY